MVPGPRAPPPVVGTPLWTRRTARPSGDKPTPSRNGGTSDRLAWASPRAGGQPYARSGGGISQEAKAWGHAQDTLTWERWCGREGSKEACIRPEPGVPEVWRKCRKGIPQASRLAGTHDRSCTTEEPCERKRTCTVLKPSQEGQPS